ncbi:vanin-like protein 1 [Diorhabda carinulata]|uniref:vanin-like protein 1 n=1 Tax=Diorhabda carinulata TaxID=1163345 RepID=UPI0025A01831|nr:vanin-like protein 1 [Diorhabda carinulata]XP_057657186.1 vanin-like protein 1 [Diorhabda carinulata]
MAVGKVHLVCFFVLTVIQYVKGDYIAAVVEYQPIILSSVNETVEQNLAQYVWYIEKAKESYVQIIVFPEYGLTGIVNDTTGYAIQIPNVGNDTDFENYWLQKLSNAARGNGIYVVTNLLEKVIDESNKTLYYSTNLVFDKNGKIVAKYRKINLSSEPQLTPGNPDQNQTTFITDFGITFGVFSSQDIFFSNPSKTILSKNVTDVVYPTSWSSFLPYFHSLTTQSGYAIANRINLLAAGLDIPEVGIGGSGIWGADGTAFAYYISGNAGSKLLIATVKNTPDMRVLGEGTKLRGFENLDNNVANHLDTYNASRFFDYDKYSFKTLNISRLNVSKEVCHKGFCCQFSVNVSYAPVNSEEVYRIMAYTGPIGILGSKKTHKICSLIGCATSDISTCGKHNVGLTTKFKRISVNTSISSDSYSFYRPISLTTNLVPVFNSTFNFVIANHARKVVYLNDQEPSDVVAFGIMETSSAVSNTFNIVFFTCIYVFHRLFL